MQTLKIVSVRCSCGHEEYALMNQSTIDYILKTRGDLIRQMPCEKCITPEMDPRKTAR